MGLLPTYPRSVFAHLICAGLVGIAAAATWAEDLDSADADGEAPTSTPIEDGGEEFSDPGEPTEAPSENPPAEEPDTGAQPPPDPGGQPPEPDRAPPEPISLRSRLIVPLVFFAGLMVVILILLVGFPDSGRGLARLSPDAAEPGEPEAVDTTETLAPPEPAEEIGHEDPDRPP